MGKSSIYINEVILLESGLAYPAAFLNFFNNDTALNQAFLSLPEEVQQRLLREEQHSEKSLWEEIERYKLKE